MTQSKKTGAIVFAATIVTAIAAVITTSAVLTYVNRNTYPSTFYIDGISIGGQTRSQLEQKFMKPDAQPQQWLLKLPNKVVALDAEEYGINIDIKATLQKADNLLILNSGSINNAILYGKKHYITSAYSCNRDQLYNRLNLLQEKTNKPAVNARILYDKGTLEYIAEKNGYILDVDATAAKVGAALKNGSVKQPVEAAIINLYPAVKIEDIKAVKDVVGAYAVAGISESAGQQLQELDGTIIMPGQMFSCQPEAVSAPEMGNALKAIIKACSEADLEIVNPSSHQLTFKNQLSDPVLISVKSFDGTLQIKIFGCQTEPGKKINLITEEQELEPEVKVRTDKLLRPNERVIKQGKTGIIKRTYRLVTIEGKQKEKTLLAQEIKPGTATIIYEGPNNTGK